MADSYLTLTDLTKINDANLADRDISDLLDEAPVLARLAADAVSGTTHKYTKETGAPTVGFRSVNDGREQGKSSDTLVTVDLKILDASHAVDQALAKAYMRGEQAYIAREASRHVKAAYFAAEQQFINGTGNDADGFNGLADAIGLASPMTVDAGGTAASTGSSVWAIRTTGDLNNVAAITGMDGVLDIGESVTQRVSGATGTYPAWYTPITAWLGLQVGGAYSVGRICNLTEDSGKGLTDALLAELLSKFPSGKMPTFFAMSRRSLFQLQASRTATNPTGAPAPIPDQAFNIPIVTTESITNTEAILS